MTGAYLPKCFLQQVRQSFTYTALLALHSTRPALCFAISLELGTSRSHDVLVQCLFAPLRPVVLLRPSGSSLSISLVVPLLDGRLCYRPAKYSIIADLHVVTTVPSCLWSTPDSIIAEAQAGTQYVLWLGQTQVRHMRLWTLSDDENILTQMRSSECTSQHLVSTAMLSTRYPSIPAECKCNAVTCDLDGGCARELSTQWRVSRRLAESKPLCHTLTQLPVGVIESGQD